MDLVNEQTAKKPKRLNESSGGYMSVDRNEALDQNWELLVKITRPLAIPEQAKKQASSIEPLRKKPKS